MPLASVGKPADERQRQSWVLSPYHLAFGPCPCLSSQGANANLLPFLLCQPTRNRNQEITHRPGCVQKALSVRTEPDSVAVKGLEIVHGFVSPFAGESVTGPNQK